jgi:hypothetical protein
MTMAARTYTVSVFEDETGDKFWLDMEGGNLVLESREAEIIGDFIVSAENLPQFIEWLHKEYENFPNR